MTGYMETSQDCACDKLVQGKKTQFRHTLTVFLLNITELYTSCLGVVLLTWDLLLRRHKTLGIKVSQEKINETPLGFVCVQM